MGALTAALGGLDALVFTGGIGENSRRSANRCWRRWSGSASNSTSQRNRANAEIISSDRSGVRLLVIPTNEELMIARHAKQILAQAAIDRSIRRKRSRRRADLRLDPACTLRQTVGAGGVACLPGFLMLCLPQ